MTVVLNTWVIVQKSNKANATKHILCNTVKKKKKKEKKKKKLLPEMKYNQLFKLY